MEKRLCEQIIQNFDFKTMEVLQDYITYRLDVLHKLLERERNPDFFRVIQGQVEELRAFAKIRDNAVAITSLKD